MPVVNLSSCKKPSGIAMLFFIQATLVANVVAGTLAGEEESVKNFVLDAPATKFDQIKLNGNHVEILETDLGSGTNKSEALINITTKHIMNINNQGVVDIARMYENCGLAIVAFLNSGEAVYIGAAGTADADSTFMGETKVFLDSSTGSTGASISDMQSGALVFKRDGELKKRFMRPLAPSLVSSFVTNFV
jgi:hypothetical protein